MLLVEDHEPDAVLVTRLLAESGRFTVVRAGRLAAALTRLAREPFDLVLLDLVLPDGQGLPVVERVVAAAPAAAVVVVSGMDDEDLLLARLAVGHGAEDHLPKGEMDGERLTRILVTAHERARLRRLLRERERRLEEAQRIGRFGYWRWQAGSGRVDLSRPLAELLGLAADPPPTPRTLLRRIRRGDRGRVLTAVRRARSAPQGAPVVVELVTVDGRPLEVELRADAAGLAGLCRDVSERRAAVRAREAFFASVGHELRTPLTALLTALDLLAVRGGDLSDPARELLTRARRGARRLADLVEGLLDRRGAVEDGRVHDLSAWLADFAAGGGGGGPGDARVVLPPVSVPVAFDPGRLAPVLRELAAAVAGGTPPVLVLTVHGACARLAVAATVAAAEAPSGPLDEAALAAAARAGRALGLAIAARLAARLRGRLRLAGPAGASSAVILELPLATADPGGSAAGEGSA